MSKLDFEADQIVSKDYLENYYKNTSAGKYLELSETETANSTRIYGPNKKSYILLSSTGLIRIYPKGDISSQQVLSVSNSRITSVGTPTASTDAATKGYVDGAISELIQKIEELRARLDGE